MTNIPSSAPMARPRPAHHFATSIARLNARSFPRNPYTHAALMYARRWSMRLSASWLMVYFCLCTCVVLIQEMNEGNWLTVRDSRIDIYSRAYKIQQMQDAPPHLDIAIFTFAYLAIFAGPALMAIHGHLKSRLGDWTATLFPRYRAQHLIVGILATIVVVVYSAALFDLVIPYSPAAVLAITVMLAALAGWLSALPQRLAATLAITVLVISSFKSVETALTIMLNRQDPAGAACFLAIATFALIGVYVRLAFVGECISWRREAEHLRLGSPHIRRHRNTPLDILSAPRRIALWRIPTSSGLLPTAAGMALFVLIAVLCILQPDNHHDYAVACVPLGCLSIITPVMAVGSQWLRRLSSLGYEFTRPTTRRAFLRDLGLSLAVDWFSWWLPMTLGGAAGVAFAVHYAAPLFSHNVPIRSASMVLLAASLSLQFLNFGLLAWTARYQIPWLIYVIITLSVLFNMFWIILCISDYSQWVPSQFFNILAAPALCGLVFTALAGYTWLRADLK